MKIEATRSNRKTFYSCCVSRTVFVTTNIPTLDFLIHYDVTGMLAVAEPNTIDGVFNEWGFM